MSRRGALALGLAVATLACGPEPAPVSDGRYVMGTVLEITLEGVSPGEGRALLDELYAEAERLEQLFSRHRQDSELSLLNGRAGAGRQPVDPDLARLLAESVELAAVTEGAFDVTVGPLVGLWWQAAERGTPPSALEIAAARARVGAGRLRVGRDDAGPWAQLEAGMSVDLGGVAKGYTLDRLAERLRTAAVRSALLSFGQSSLHGIGAPADGDGWGVLVRDADDGFAGVAYLRDQSLSVSGSLGQGLEIDGRRYGHVIDPRSGQPLTRNTVAVVLAATGTRAEALAKALLVLPPDKGIALLESLPDAEGLLLEPGALRQQTPGWRSAARFHASR